MTPIGVAPLDLRVDAQPRALVDQRRRHSGDRVGVDVALVVQHVLELDPADREQVLGLCEHLRREPLDLGPLERLDATGELVALGLELGGSLTRGLIAALLPGRGLALVVVTAGLVVDLLLLVLVELVVVLLLVCAHSAPPGVVGSVVGSGSGVGVGVWVVGVGFGCGSPPHAAVNSTAVAASAAQAAGSGMPWEAPLQRILESIEAASKAARHDVIVAEVSDPREWSLPACGLLTLVDPETGALLEVQTSDRRLRGRFEEAAARRRTEIEGAVRQANARHLRLSTDRDWMADFVGFARSTKRAV